jgi:hypothetical protein
MPLSRILAPSAPVISHLKKALAPAALLVSLSSLILFGIVGLGRTGHSNLDGAVLYAAGRAWLVGANPYNHDELVRSVDGTGIVLSDIFFFYPPQSAGLCVPLAFFEYPTAKLIWAMTNLVAIAAIVAMLIRINYRFATNDREKIGGWVISAFAIGSPFTTHVVWMGQTSLVAVAATYGAWFFSREERWRCSGLCLGLATFKPQICILLLVWFALQRNWTVLTFAAIAAGLLSIYPAMTQGPVGMVTSWLDGLSEYYSSLVFNRLGFDHTVGLQNFLGAAGVAAPDLIGLSLCLTFVLWMIRTRINTEDVLSILMLLTFAFVGHLHDYDYVGLTCVLATLWLYTSNESRSLATLISLTLLLCIPQRMLRAFHIPALNHWRDLIVLVFLFMLIRLSLSHRTSLDHSKIALNTD